MHSFPKEVHQSKPLLHVKKDTTPEVNDMLLQYYVANDRLKVVLCGDEIWSLKVTLMFPD
jgi:hypothetical protein